MAQFTAQLSEPSANYGSIAPTRTGGESELASLISGGLQVFETLERRKAMEASQLQEAQEKQAAIQKGIDTDKALAGATSSVLDLENEALGEKIIEEDITQRMYALKKDGVTAEEQRLLEDLQIQANRLKLVDPRQRQIRLNALQKQALNSSIGLNIQSEINTIFGSGRSAIDDYKAPEHPPEVLKQLQDTYGPSSSYTPEQTTNAYTSVVARERMMKDAQLNVQSWQENSSLAAFNTTQGLLTEAANVIKVKGHLGPEDYTVLQGRLAGEKIKVLKNLQLAASTWTGRGVDVTQDLKNATASVEASFSAMEGLLRPDGGVYDAVQTKKIMDNVVNVTNLLNKTHDTESATLISSFLGNDKNPQPLFDLLGANDQIIEEVFSTQLGMPIKAKEAKARIAKAIDYLMNPKTAQDAVDAGLLSRRELAVASGNYVLSNSKDPETTSRALKPLVEVLDTTNVKGIMEALIEPKNYRATREQAKDSRVQAQLQAVNARIADTIMTKIPPNLHNSVSVSVTGDLSIPTPDVKALQAGQDVQELIKLYNRFTTDYGDVLGGKKAIADNFYQTLNPKKQEEQTKTQE